MNCLNPIRLFGKNGSSKGERFQLKYPDGLKVPCGKCLQCRIKRRTEWSLRLIHELSYHEDSIFITLTYAPEYIPENNSLKKTDLQKYFKRLRKDLNGRKIKYFACGEYGDQTKRPHYHAIIFGMSLSKEDKKLLQENWPKGMLHYGLAEKDSIRYVAQYIDKKFSGAQAQREYQEKLRTPVFKLSSLGLGKAFAEENKQRIIKDKCIHRNGVKMSIPRYYLKKLGIDTAEFIDHAVESEAQEIEDLTGINMSDFEAYNKISAKDYAVMDDKRKKRRQQNDSNIKGKIRLKERKL